MRHGYRCWGEPLASLLHLEAAICRELGADRWPGDRVESAADAATRP